MSCRDVRAGIRGAARPAFCALAIVLATAAGASASPRLRTSVFAPVDTAASAAADTLRADSIRADTARAKEKGAVWKMDELKRVLGDETAGLKPGAKYHERKNGRVAMACALLVPGLGQIYNEKPFKAAVVLGAETYYLGHVYLYRRYWAREKIIRDSYPVGSFAYKYHEAWVRERWEQSVDWIWWSGAMVLAAVIDAYVDAHLDDMRFHVEPRATEAGVGVSLVVPY